MRYLFFNLFILFGGMSCIFGVTFSCCLIWEHENMRDFPIPNGEKTSKISNVTKNLFRATWILFILSILFLFSTNFFK